MYSDDHRKPGVVAGKISARNRAQRAAERKERERRQQYQRTLHHHWSCTCLKCESTGLPITPDSQEES